MMTINRIKIFAFYDLVDIEEKIKNLGLATDKELANISNYIQMCHDSFTITDIFRHNWNNLIDPLESDINPLDYWGDKNPDI